MAILYQTAKFKSADILVITIWGSTANISSYTVINTITSLHTNIIIKFSIFSPTQNPRDRVPAYHGWSGPVWGL